MTLATICGLSLAPRAAAEVDLLFDPPMQTIVLNVNDEFEINLVAHSDDDTEQLIVALDAILSWEAPFLELLGVATRNAGYNWLFIGFPIDQDDINDGTSDPPIGVPANDGDAICKALGQPGNPAAAGRDDLIVTTLQFRALQQTSGTTVSFLPSAGQFGLTRVFGIDGRQDDITGDISATATVVIVQSTCFADFDHNGQVDAFDLAVLLGSWDSCPDPCVPEEPSETCPTDLDLDCNVGPFDLALLLGNWGPCE